MACVADPRRRRGVRHPFSGILALTLVALLCRRTEFAAIQRWAGKHWHLLQRPLGFRRHRPPHATTLSRTLAKFSLDEFQTAFSNWLAAILADQTDLVAAVDGKTSKQAFQSEDHPIQMLNVFVQDVKACLGQWPLSGDKSTEPEVLKSRLNELFTRYPGLRLLTGDALYAQRNLAELIVESGHDYLLQIKANQPDILDAAETCFAGAEDRKADVCAQEKKVDAPKLVFFGSTWTTPSMFGSGWVLPVAASSCDSIAVRRTRKGKRPAKRATSSPASTRLKSRPDNC
jgi:hypothetical protein